MKTNILFSIILPAYNVADYITTGIESVIAQKYGNWELIIIDDGSTDETGRICDEYAQKDDRIIVVHQENAGRLKGWQKAARMSKGDYICTVDGDDWVEDELLQFLYDNLSKRDVDIICYEYFTHMSDKCGKVTVVEDYYKRDDEFYVAGDSLLDFVLVTSYHSDWGKCFKRSLFEYSQYEIDTYEKNRIIFNTDLYQVLPLICNSNEVLMSSRGLIHYRVHPGTMSNSNRDILSQIVNVFDTIEFVLACMLNRGKLTPEREKMAYYECMRQFYPRARQTVRTLFRGRKYRSIVAEHSFYGRFIGFFTVKEVIRYCRNRKKGVPSTLLYYLAFRMMIGGERNET